MIPHNHNIVEIPIKQLMKKSCHLLPRFNSVITMIAMLIAAILCLNPANATATDYPTYLQQSNHQSDQAANVYVDVGHDRFLVGRFNESGDLSHYLMYDGRAAANEVVTNLELTAPLAGDVCESCWNQTLVFPSDVPNDVNEQVVATYRNPGTSKASIHLPEIPEFLEQIEDQATTANPPPPSPPSPAPSPAAPQKTQPPTPPNEKNGAKDLEPKDQTGDQQSTSPLEGEQSDANPPSTSLLDESLRRGTVQSFINGGLNGFSSALLNGVANDFAESQKKNQQALDLQNQNLQQAIAEGTDSINDFHQKHNLNMALGSPEPLPSTPTNQNLSHYEFQSKDQDFVGRAKEVQKLLRDRPYRYSFSKDVQDIGFESLRVADEEDLAGDIESREKLLELARGMADLMVGIDPFTGFARSAYELATGKNLITGEPLSNFEMGVAAFGLVTLGFGSSAKALTKLGLQLTKPSTLAFFKVLRKFPGGKVIGTVENLSQLIKQGKHFMGAVGATTLRKAQTASAVGQEMLKTTGNISIDKARLAVDWVTDRKTRMGIKEAVDASSRTVEVANRMGLGAKAELRGVGQYIRNTVGHEPNAAQKIEDALVKAGSANLKAYSLATEELAKSGKALSRNADEFISNQVRYGDEILGVGKTFTREDLVHSARKYDELAAKIDDIAPTSFDGEVWRAVPERIPGVDKANTIHSVFDFHPGTKLANGRYSAPGESAIYASLGKRETAWQTVMEELGQTADQPLILNSRRYTLDKVLDLTDHKVRSTLDLAEKELTYRRSNAYQLTHVVGDIAKRKRFDAIKYPSAVFEQGTNLVILGE
jgi:RES domain-containing protein